MDFNIDPVFDRSKPVEDISEVHFQALSWYGADFESQSPTDDEKIIKQYIIFINGVNALGQSVCLRVRGFLPYFYVQVPKDWNTGHAEKFFKYIKNKLSSNNPEYDHEYALVSHDLVKWKKLYPYLAEKKFNFIRLIFSSEKAFDKAKWLFTEQNQDKYPIDVKTLSCPKYFEAFETHIPHINRFCHIRNIETTGWIRVQKFTEELEYSTAQINITAHWKQVCPDSETRKIAPWTIFSWDIECLPENTEEFPNPNIPGDKICQISAVLCKYGTEHVQKFIFTSKPCLDIRGSTVIRAKNEKKMLENFCEFVKLTDPDLFTGYNTWGFDDNYLWTRINGTWGKSLDVALEEEKKQGKTNKRFKGYDIDMSSWSRITDLQPKIEVKELKSSAYGDNEFVYILCPGRETFDMLVAIRKENKLDSNSLDFVSKYFLKNKCKGPDCKENASFNIPDKEPCYCTEHKTPEMINTKETKVEMPYRELFRKLGGGPEDIAECAIYCIQDSNLVIRLLLKLNMIPNFVEMAKASWVPMGWLLIRGQQCKVFSLVAKKAREFKYIIPVMNRKKNTDYKKFKGATVIEPHCGLYYEPIVGLDFASLYPSIIRAWNMCYSTLIESSAMLEYVKANNIPYKTVEWTEKPDPKDLIQKTTHYSFSFVQIEDQKGQELSGGTRGLLGIILSELAKDRSAAKKLMAAETDPLMKAVYNGKQLAIKVTMNSVYGFTGATEFGILPCKPIAASVTAMGREMIEQTSQMAADEFGAFTIYGDSIPGWELITVNQEDRAIQEFAEGLDNPWQEYRGFMIRDTEIRNKLCKNLEGTGLQTLTHQGLQDIKKVIKHTTKKKLFNIQARDTNGKIHTVTVTEGHSLVLNSGKLVSAEDLQIGDLLANYV